MVRKILSNSLVLFIIFVVMAIIIPLPSWLLDFMIMLNIALSLIILVMTMFIKEALEFSVFPTVLLISTVLRLSLNISTTRGILS
ncbi:MAG: FHIPEP family type III secretion protein, partial [Oscillospiraceae bacterium]